MGKLVLTGRAGESVKLTEPNGREWLLETVATRGLLGSECVTLKLHEPLDRNIVDVLRAGQSMCFAGGNVELRPHKRPDQAILAFDFPRDVTIVRTEIA